MKFRKVCLEDIADTCLGKMLDKNKNRGEYQPYLANINVRWGAFDLDNLSQMRFLDTEQERYGLKYGDLVVCEGGEPGRCAIWKDQIPEMKIQKALHRVRVKKDVDFRYLYFWFLLAGKRNALEQYFTGATIKHMPEDKLKRIVVTIPTYDEQIKIANVLSNYDDLIENNQKQIKLLEEVAQRLYKEWFVDLHFPGYEEAEIIDGLPKGWEIKKVDELLQKVQKKAKVKASEYMSEGKIPIVDQSRKFIAGYTNNQESLSDELPAIIFGDHTRIIKYIQFPYARGADGTQVIISNTSRMPQALFYCALKNIDLSNHHYARHFKYLKEKNVLLPERTISGKFNDIADVYFTNIMSLRKMNARLSEARDRLLPKLMSGEIEV
jgi:type I restriction enzyme S subunit